MKKKTTQKEYIVIGLGRFGSSVARQLEANGCRVLAIDRQEKRVNQIADYVTLAMCVDVANEEALRELGGRNFDGAIISIGHSLDASVLAAIWAKEQGIGKIVAKAHRRSVHAGLFLPSDAFHIQRDDRPHRENHLFGAGQHSD